MSNFDSFITPAKYLKRQSSELESTVEKMLISCLHPLYVTDSIPQQKRFTDLPLFKVYSIGSDLALTINRIHFNSSVSEVFLIRRNKQE